MTITVFMTNYSKILNNAWEYLIKEYQKGMFKPSNEAEIQAFLYHSLIKKGLDPSKIHLERPGEKPGEKGRRCDVVLGPKRLFIEIKWSYPKNRIKPSVKWKKDLEKLKEWGGNRKPVLVLFVAEGNGRYLSEKEYKEKYPGLIKTIKKLKQDISKDALVLSYPRT